ncbi:MAG: PKD domain-containing protein [Candidatus Thermoplasmatota archaeon]|nr:PKD domain-containing protein [Candidatus Thermoplasmatota archaeon]
MDHWRSYPDRTSLTMYFLDDENLSLYRSGARFRPGAALTLARNTTGTVTLGHGRGWTIVAPGLSLPMTRTVASLKVEVLLPVPSARILSPLPGTYSTEDILFFSGMVEPIGPYIESMKYVWSTDRDPALLSDSQSFHASLEAGEHNITFLAWNDTGIVSRAYVDIVIERPNHPPVAVISSPLNGSVFLQGEVIRFLSNGSYDPDQDPLDYLWSEVGALEPLSIGPGFERAFTTGTHNVTFWVMDPFQLGSSATVTFSVIPLNNPPVPYISSPKPWTVHTLGEPVLLSANGTFDLDGDPLNYDWNSSKDGHLSSSKEELVLLSEGYHTITLSVSDGTFVREVSVSIDIYPIEPPKNRPPVALISSPGDGDSFYVSDDILLTSEGTFDPEGGPMTFNWTMNGVHVSSMDALTLNLDGGIWTIALNVSDGGLWGVDSVTIVVYDRSPVVVLKVNGTIWQESMEVRTFEKDQMVLDASGSYDPDGTDLKYEWSINGTLHFYGPVWVTNFTADFHIIELTVTDGGGKAASFSLQLRALSRGGGPEPPDDGPERDDRGLPALAIVALGVILLSVVAIVVLYFLTRRVKRSGAVWED